MRYVAAIALVLLAIVLWPRRHDTTTTTAPATHEATRVGIRRAHYVTPTDGGVSPISIEQRLALGWGAGPSQVGKRHDPESAGEGPMSFVVARDGTLYILDQVNGRITRRKDGQWLAPIKLKGDTAQDLRVDKNGSIAVLDRLGDKSLQRYDSQGHESDIKLASTGVVDPGGATGLYDDDAGALYVEESLRDEGKRVLHPESGGPVLVGRPSRDGAQLVDAAITSRMDGQLVVRGSDLAGSTRWESAIAVAPMIVAIILCDTDSSGRVYLGVLHATLAVPDLQDERLDVFRLSASGDVLGHISLPRPPSTLEQLHELSVSADGTVWWLHAAADGSGMIVDALTL